MSKEKNENEEFIQMLLHHIETKNISTEEKTLYSKKILKYIKMEIDYYKTMGIDISLGALIFGMGVGSSVIENDTPYLPFIFYGLGSASLIVTYIKRNIKYKRKIKSFREKEISILKEKV